VRDLLLGRPNFDIDFVVEEDAIAFAEGLSRRWGGEVKSFKPFGTAKWLLTEAAAAALELDFTELPDHVDFATARNEFYEHPTALPTVYNSSIKLDLQRRDFTINALAVELFPSSGHILDYYGGLRDLQAGLIRVLHSLSFVDDPTRILRAVRFKRRLGFTIEPRTAELIAGALPMLGRITGERLRNEFMLLLHEEEPERGLLELQAYDALRAIHPAFVVRDTLLEQFRGVRTATRPWSSADQDIAQLYWHVLAAGIPSAELADWCKRLMFGQRDTQSLLDVAWVLDQLAELQQPDLRPSQVVRLLSAVSEWALLTVWLVTDTPLVRERIQRYWLEWRHMQPVTTGHSLKARGLKPGPCYRIILERLQTARLDGRIQTEMQENELIEKWVNEERICDDSP
jgi:tRNA nucleotidyltransferase (CCA-adding enzyme)